VGNLSRAVRRTNAASRTLLMSAARHGEICAQFADIREDIAANPKDAARRGAQAGNACAGSIDRDRLLDAASWCTIAQQNAPGGRCHAEARLL
jgi:hypothetical protein